MSSSTILFFGSCFAICFHTLVAEEPTAHWPNGNDECPCIDPWSRGLQLNQGTSQPIGCSMVRYPERVCYSDSYGAQGCKRHDWNATPECARAHTKEEWCGALWCYVDGTDCKRDFGKSRFFPNATITSESGTQQLVYSYATCGWVDTFSDEDAVQPLLDVAASRSSGKLRVGFPSTDSGSGYTVVGPPQVKPGQGVGGTDRAGSFLSFMNDAFSKRNIPWELSPVSNRSHEFEPNSSFTACVHEVAIGNLDMCWGNFWPTALRSKIASFAQPVYHDKFYLIVYKRDDSVNLWEAMLKPFAPFTLSLWLTLLIVFGYSGMVMIYHSDNEHACLAKSLLFQLPRSIVSGWQAMFSGEFGGVEIHSLGGWFVTIAAGFSVLVMFTGYTAIVTTDLLSERKLGTVRSLEEGIQRGLKICSNDDLEELLVARYPGLEPYFVGTALGDAVSMMDLGNCDGAIIHDDLWHNVRAKSQTHCVGDKAKVKLPHVVATVANSIPVRPNLVPAVSWIVRKETESGRYLQYQRNAQNEFRGPACAESTSQGSEGEKNQFAVWDMAGPLSLLAIVSTVSMIITFTSRRVERKAKRLAEAFSDGEFSAAVAEVVNSVTRKASIDSRSSDVPPSSSQRDSPESTGRPSAAEEVLPI